jgi:hypothetical protein
MEQAAIREPAASRTAFCFGEVRIVFSSGRMFAVVEEEIPNLRRGLIIS